MSQPPPLYSPDGRHYWDGARWVPRYAPPIAHNPSKSSNATGVVVGGLFIVGLIIVGLIWYFVFYDTAAAKCNRGDLGACMVVAGQQAAAAASAAASDAAVQASANAAAQQMIADRRNQLEAAMVAGCTVVWDPNHNMRLTYIGPNRDSNCASTKSKGWTDARRVAGSKIVCQNTALVVEDTGGMALGTDLCDQLGLPLQP